jgi:hypothetical protein
MKKCDYDKFLVDFACNELQTWEYKTIEIHIRTCSACSKKLAEFQNITSLLKSRKREKPPVDFMNCFDNNLEQLFTQHVNKHSMIVRIIQFFRYHYLLRIRFEIGFALLLLGFGIGYFVTQSKFSSRQAVLTPQIIVVPGLMAESGAISKFLTDAEIVILSLTNFKNVKDVEFPDILIYKKASGRLVSETTNIRDYALLIEDENLHKIIIHLEQLLLEIANIQEDDFQQKLMKIREVAKEEKLFRKVKSFKDGLQTLNSNNI